MQKLQSGYLPSSCLMAVYDESLEGILWRVSAGFAGQAMTELFSRLPCVAGMRVSMRAQSTGIL